MLMIINLQNDFFSVPNDYCLIINRDFVLRLIQAVSYFRKNEDIIY